MRRLPLMYVSLALICFVVAGLLLEPVAARDDIYKPLSNFADTLDVVQRSYVEPVDPARLMEGAYRGLIEELDTDSYYLSPALLKRWRAMQARPERAGIGAEVAKRHGYAVVLSVLPGSPADGKLSTGDYLRFIGPTSTRELSLFEIRELLEGPPGSQCKVKAVRREDPGVTELAFTRGTLPPPAVSTRHLSDGVLHVHPYRIDESAVGDIAAALRASSDLAGVVLDLRGTAWGPVPAGSQLANLFLDSGLLLRVQGKRSEAVVKRLLGSLPVVRTSPRPPGTAGAGEQKATPPPGFEYQLKANSDRVAWRGPLVVVVDQGTAGAAEVAAAALRDAGRARLLGGRSFGRGGLQDLLPIEDGAALHLTVAEFLTPKGESLLRKGLEPDRTVSTFPEKDGKDPALEAALEELRKSLDAAVKKAA